jgi:hypothetical protein
LQAAESGGEFVFLPNSRTDETEVRDLLDPFLSGDRSKTKTFSRGIGTFTLFRGEYSLQGVTKVEGVQPRVTGIFTCEENLQDHLECHIQIETKQPVSLNRELQPHRML